MKNFLTLILAIACIACNKSRENKTKATVQAPPNSQTEVVIKKPERFPESWFGEWSGDLQIYNARGLSQTVPMTCLMSQTDTVGVYNWSIIYGEDKVKGLRPYLLRTIDAAKGHYLCDEMNTIKMESYLLGQKLFCNYSVQGNWLTSTYEKQGDKMIFEIVFGKEKAVSESGGQKHGGDDIPVVKTFPVVISQKAILTRK